MNEEHGHSNKISFVSAWLAIFCLKISTFVLIKVLLTYLLTHFYMEHAWDTVVHPNYTRNTPHPLNFYTLGVALLRQTGRPTACEEV